MSHSEIIENFTSLTFVNWLMTISIGGSLCSAPLDGDALAEALIMIPLEGRSEDLLTIYSDECRKVFQAFVDPTTTANKLRLQSPDPDAAIVDDYYFWAMQNTTPELLVNAARPSFETWRTDMRHLAREADL